MITQKMEVAGIRNKEAYFRKMVLGGYILRLDLSDVREMTKLLSNATNNLNQIAKRVNADGSIFASDIKDIQDNYDCLHEQAEKILLSLANIQK
ncbi:MAG: plasmid mobilization relaxosome protein MobC [Oscillospiraceae bacterium]|nr:plasmid mobilization relaxosome protein MobC [Oscillospiraceae bacterium]